MDYHGHETGYSYDYILSGDWSGSWMTGSASACGVFCFYTQNDPGWCEINLGSRTKPRIIIGVNMSSMTRIIRNLPHSGLLADYILLHIRVGFSLITRVLQVLVCFVLVFFTKVLNFCIIPVQVLKRAHLIELSLLGWYYYAFMGWSILVDCWV